MKIVNKIKEHKEIVAMILIITATILLAIMTPRSWAIKMSLYAPLIAYIWLIIGCIVVFGVISLYYSQKLVLAHRVSRKK